MSTKPAVICLQPPPALTDYQFEFPYGLVQTCHQRRVLTSIRSNFVPLTEQNLYNLQFREVVGR